MFDKARKIHFSSDNQFISPLKDIFLSEILIFVKCYLNTIYMIQICFLHLPKIKK
jgi:hypothetical protein